MKRLSDQTLYEILDVREDAPVTEIEAACQRALALYGPGSLATYTLMTPDEASLLTRRIEEARATLLDPGARARYDEALQHRPAEPVAAASGANGAGAGFTSLPPVIPAAQPPQPPAEAPRAAQPAHPAEPRASPAPGPGGGIEEARPAILLADALQAGPAPEEGGRDAAVPPAQKPILLQHEIPPKLPAPAPAAVPPPRAEAKESAAPVPMPAEGEGWTGEALRAVREARGLGIQQMAERTKVTRHHIENIEGDRFAALPAPVYLRGILLSIARELRLDGQKVARSYLDRAAAALGRK